METKTTESTLAKKQPAAYVREFNNTLEALRADYGDTNADAVYPHLIVDVDPEKFYGIEQIEYRVYASLPRYSQEVPKFEFVAYLGNATVNGKQYTGVRAVPNYHGEDTFFVTKPTCDAPLTASAREKLTAALKDVITWDWCKQNEWKAYTATVLGEIRSAISDAERRLPRMLEVFQIPAETVEASK